LFVLFPLQDDDYDVDDFSPEEDSMAMSLGMSVPSGSSSKMDFMQYAISPGFKL
jgi:hypothetical protein